MPIVTTTVTPDRTATVRRNVRLLTAYDVFADLMPFFAIWVVYLTDFRSLTLAQVGILEGVFWGIKVIAEMPTGAFADRFGRKPTFVVGTIVEASGIVAFAFAGNFVLLLASYLLWAAGLAFRSGNGEAFLYDTLAEVDETDDFARVQGRIQAFAGVAALLGGVMGAVVAEVIDLQAAVLTATVPYALALAAALRLDEPERSDAGGSIGYVQTLVSALAALRDYPAVRYLILFEVSISTVAVSQFLLLQPYFSSHDVPLALFGVLLIPLRVGSIIGSYFGHWITRRLGLRRQLALTLVTSVVGVGIVAIFDSLWAFAGFLLTAPALGALYPATRAYVNDRTVSRIRATVLSFAPFGQSVTFALAATTTGLIANVDLQLAFGVSAASVGIVSGLWYLLWLGPDRRGQRRGGQTEAASPAGS